MNTMIDRCYGIYGGYSGYSGFQMVLIGGLALMLAWIWSYRRESRMRRYLVACLLIQILAPIIAYYLARLLDGYYWEVLTFYPELYILLAGILVMILAFLCAVTVVSTHFIRSSVQRRRAPRSTLFNAGPRTNRLEMFSRLGMVAARATAGLFAIMGVWYIGLFISGLISMHQRRAQVHNVFNWGEFFFAIGFASFIGYAIFIMFPVQRLPLRIFKVLIGIGILLCLGSVPGSILMYATTVEYTLDGAWVSRFMSWIMLFAVYAYIPLVIINRRQIGQQSGAESPPQGDGSPAP
jgi:hypothetical protein